MKLFVKLVNGEVRSYNDVTVVHINIDVLYFWHSTGHTRVEFKMKDVVNYVFKKKGWN